jgi:hypothetical protein
MRPEERGLPWDARAKYARHRPRTNGGQWRASFQDVARLGNPRQLPLQPPVPGFMVNPGHLRRRLGKQPKPLVKKARTHPEALRSLPNRRPAHPDLLHRVPPEPVAAIARPHPGPSPQSEGAKRLQIQGHPWSGHAPSPQATRHPLL